MSTASAYEMRQPTDALQGKIASMSAASHMVPLPPKLQAPSTSIIRSSSGKGKERRVDPPRNGRHTDNGEAGPELPGKVSSSAERHATGKAQAAQKEPNWTVKSSGKANILLNADRHLTIPLATPLGAQRSPLAVKAELFQALLPFPAPPQVKEAGFAATNDAAAANTSSTGQDEKASVSLGVPASVPLRHSRIVPTPYSPPPPPPPTQLALETHRVPLQRRTFPSGPNSATWDDRGSSYRPSIETIATSQWDIDCEEPASAPAAPHRNIYRQTSVYAQGRMAASSGRSRSSSSVATMDYGHGVQTHDSFGPSSSPRATTRPPASDHSALHGQQSGQGSPMHSTGCFRKDSGPNMTPATIPRKHRVTFALPPAVDEVTEAKEEAQPDVPFANSGIKIGDAPGVPAVYPFSRGAQVHTLAGATGALADRVSVQGGKWLGLKLDWPIHLPGFNEPCELTVDGRGRLREKKGGSASLLWYRKLVTTPFPAKEDLESGDESDTGEGQREFVRKQRKGKVLFRSHCSKPAYSSPRGRFDDVIEVGLGRRGPTAWQIQPPIRPGSPPATVASSTASTSSSSHSSATTRQTQPRPLVPLMWGLRTDLDRDPSRGWFVQHMASRNRSSVREEDMTGFSISFEDEVGRSFLVKGSVSRPIFCLLDASIKPKTSGPAATGGSAASLKSTASVARKASTMGDLELAYFDCEALVLNLDVVALAASETDPVFVVAMFETVMALRCDEQAAISRSRKSKRDERGRLVFDKGGGFFSRFLNL